MTYDAFMFFNELDLLDIRLNVHSSYVDRFILTESTHTHSGNPKPLYFQNNKHLFEPFLNRIEHVIIDDPAMVGRNAWINEAAHRNALTDAIKKTKDDDTIFFADLDEILDFPKLQSKPGPQMPVMLQYWYYLNVSQPELWKSPSIFKKSDIDWNAPLNKMRNTGKLTDNVCGWHFTYMGGPARVKQKIQAYSHSIDFDRPHIVDESAIANRMAQLKDVLCRCYPVPFKRVELSETTHPKYVLDNLSKFSHLIQP